MAGDSELRVVGKVERHPRDREMAQSESTGMGLFKDNVEPSLIGAGGASWNLSSGQLECISGCSDLEKPKSRRAEMFHARDHEETLMIYAEGI